MPIYIAPVTQAASRESPTIIMESPIKALAIASLSMPALGLGGTPTTLTRTGHTRRLNDSWSRVEVAERAFVVLFDSNRMTNPCVARDEGRLAWALESSGAKVSIASLPRTANRREQGPDDFLAATGPDALKEVIQGAFPADPVTRAELASADTAPELLDDLPFLLAVHERGPACKKRVRDALKACANVTLKEFDSAMARAARKLRDAHAGERPQGEIASQYEVREGAICRIEHTFRDGEVGDISTPLCNFTASIKREVVTDDGVSESRTFEVDGRLAGDIALERIVLTPDEFCTGLWPMQQWGSRAIVSADRGTAEHLRAAIQEMSHPEVLRTYSHTGWRLIDGQPVFLNANGAIGAGGIQTRLSGRLSRYCLPWPPQDPATALRTSLRFLDIAPRRVILPLFAAVYRAPVQSILYCDSVVWVCGKTGSLKSTISALALAHFGQFDRNAMPAAWHDTFAHIEFTGSSAKDVLYTLDDYAPRAGDSRDELRRKAELVIRSFGNHAGRARMRADLTEHAERPPRGLMISTGEDLPNGESILARILPLHLERAEVNTAVLSELQAQQGQLPHAMAAFIDWLRPQYNTVGERLRERFAVLRSDFERCQTHLRTPEALAHLALGIELFSDFSATLGVMNRREAAHFVEEAMVILGQLGDVQGETVADENPTEEFLRWLRTLLAQGKVEIATDRKQPLLPVGATQQIGWLDGDAAYLLPEATFAAVVSAMRGAGVSMPLKEATLWSRLRAAGAISAGDDGHATAKRVCGGKRERVIIMALKALGLGEPSGGPEGGAPAPSGPSQGGEESSEAGQTRGEPGRETNKAGRAAAATGGGEEEDQLVSSSSSSRPAAPAGEAASCMANFSPQGAAQRIERDQSPRNSSRAGEDRGAGAPPLNSAESQQDPRPGDGCAPRIVTGAQLPPLEYQLVCDAAGLPVVAAAVAGAGMVALDVETTGLDPHKDRPRLLQLGMPDGKVVVVDLFQTGGIGPVAEALGRVELLGHNLQFDLGFLHRFGVRASRVWDTMTAAKLHSAGAHLKEKGYHALAAVCSRHLQINLPKDLQKSDWSGVLSQEQIEYAVRDVAVLPLLKAKLKSALAESGLGRVAALEFAVIPVVVEMEHVGVGFDRTAWATLVAERTSEAEKLGRTATSALGIANADSPKQVREALVRHGIPAKSTSAKALALFRGRPAVAALLDYRRAVGFVRNQGKAVASALDLRGDGRVHAHFNPLAAPTGRFGCSDPPLLSLPKAAAVRKTVVPNPGYLFVCADYAAIELRVLAQITKDPGLLEVFGTGGDPHRRTAAAMVGVHETQVRKEDRQKAKAVNFGFAFGMGADRFVSYALSDYGLSFSNAEAERFKALYRRAHPGVARWQQDIGAQMPLEVRTASGRLQRFDIRTEGYCERLNTPVQGTAADGMKAALVLLHERLPALGARLVLCIHDEVLVEASIDRAEEVEKVVEASMVEGMQRFVTAVPIVVEASIRSTWAESKEQGVEDHGKDTT
ncbi:MAG: DUF3854 domain-containing protein [Deltaproteobacteria bacterium]|nr:DUF3854 domain-containing protein [Deltaproteobacteria bacterium]